MPDVTQQTPPGRLYGEPFAIIPEWLLDDLAVSDRAVRLFGVLARYANSREGVASPKRRTLATRLGCSVDTIDRAVQQLVDVGALVREPCYDDAGDQTSNNYWVWPSRPGGRVGAATGGRDDAAPMNDRKFDREVVPAVPPAGAAGARPPDLLFEAVAAACGVDWRAGITTSARGALNKAVAELRGAGATPADVAGRAANYRLHFDAALTPSALARQWAQVAHPPPARVSRRVATGRGQDAIANVFDQLEGNRR